MTTCMTASNRTALGLITLLALVSAILLTSIGPALVAPAAQETALLQVNWVGVIGGAAAVIGGACGIVALTLVASPVAAVTVTGYIAAYTAGAAGALQIWDSVGRPTWSQIRR